MAMQDQAPEILYAIGDIHGHLDKLEQVHRRIEADAGRSPHLVVHIGDLVDRGPESRGVIEYLRTGMIEGRPWVVLKGNHDRMMERFLANGDRDERLRSDWTWLHPNLGATETLASYGLDIDGLAPREILLRAQGTVPPDHLDFLAGLPASFETEDVFFCHAGILPGVPLDAQTEDDLLWIRGPFLDHPGPHPKLIVHGHTPVRHVTHAGCRINIDTGAAYGGPLSAVALEGGAAFELTEVGRRPLVPGG